jgi:Tol biopolymer transport system component/DNA-binding winged helix-turn-helix (wHTH) protein
VSATGSPQVSDRSFRFGPFELSERQAELRKNGVRIKLQEQPFQVLLELLANAGDIVTREELQQHLWPADTFVDFNVGVNTAIRKIRLALNDDADNPHYVETISKRGYRFIAEVTVQEAITPSLLTESPSGSVSLPPIVVVPETKTERATALTEGIALSAEAPAKEAPRRKAILAVAAALLAVACGLLYYAARPYPIPTIKEYKQLTFDGKAKGIVGVDGARIYLSLSTPEYSGVAELSTAGGEIRKVPLLPTHTAAPLQLSADGTQVLFIDPSPANAGSPPAPFFSVPILGGAPQRLRDAKGLDARWSSDRSLLAYNTFDTIFLANGDGTGSRKVITPPGLKDTWGIQALDLSPDGRVIRFSIESAPGTPEHIWEVKSDGTGLHQILPGFSNSDEPFERGGWSPDGQYYFFHSDGKLWVLPERRSFLSPQPKPVRLTPGPIVFGLNSLSSDHRYLYAFGATFGGELVRYDLQSGLYAPYLGGISAEYVSFSPDRQWVAYVKVWEGTLWRSRADGSERLRLTVPPGNVINPRWSPDGKTIYYGVDLYTEAKMKMFQVSVDGGDPKAILPEDKENPIDPNPSPDGKKLVFARDPHSDEPAPNGISPKTSIHFLDLNTGEVSLLPGSEGKAGPRWSPDGRYIAAQAWDSKKMFLYDLKTRQWVEVDRGKLMGWQVFSHDGRFLYYQDRDVNDIICRLRMSDRHVDRFPLKNFSAIGHWGLALSLGPDDMPLLLRDKMSDDIYALELEWK